LTAIQQGAERGRRETGGQARRAATPPFGAPTPETKQALLSFSTCSLKVLTAVRQATRGAGGTAVYTRNALDPLFFEDLELGGRWLTRGRTITEADITAHAGVSGDFGPLHMDAQRAAQGHFGGRVAHGSLLISVAIGLGAMDVPQPNLVALVGTNWRFLKPVKPGGTVHAVWRLGRKRDVTNPRWGLAVWQIELLDQGDERVLEGEVTLLVNRRQPVTGAPAARSRRRRRGKAVAPPALPTAEANLPEPAPADTPAPARRRRRSSKTAVAAPAETPAPEPAGAPTEISPPSSTRRRRRRRGSGGGGNGAAAAPVASEPQVPAEPPRSQWAAPEPAPAPPAAAPDSNNPVSRVLGRLRRTRRAGPAPEGTRSPSE
jgi:acyl dehydratase